MTLAERLKKYKSDNHLQSRELANLCGVDVTAMSKALNGGHTAMIDIKRIADVLGGEFENYVEYTTCKCGKKYIATRYLIHYCSKECSKKYQKELAAENRKRLLQVGRKPKPTPPVSDAVQFAGQAKKEKVTYGERQAAERLANSRTMRESMGSGCLNLTPDRPVRERKHKLDDIVWVVHTGRNGARI